MKKKLHLFIIFTILSSLSFSNDLKGKLIDLINQRESISEEIKLLEKRIKEEELSLNSRETHKKVGVVLSGGGAKGFAHIGVLRALEQNGIKIDYLSGNSMGAIVAALYSVGYSPDDIESILKELDLDTLLKGEVDRRDIPLEKRVDNINSMVTLRFDDEFNFSLPKGLRNSNMSYLKLKSLLYHVEGVKSFDEFPIPLRIVATDLNSGDSVSFKEGDLARVLAASFAIPTILDPVKINDRQYLDGMLSSNFPVKELVDMGADIIIGSNVGVTVGENKEHNVVSIFNQLLAVTSSRGTESQKSLTSILIEPEIDSFSPTDFSPVDELISKGEEATLSQMEEIKKLVPHETLALSLESNHYNTNKNNSVKVVDKRVNIHEITFKNSNIDKNIVALIEDNFKPYLFVESTPEELEVIFKRLLALDFINKIFYEIDRESGKLILDIESNPNNTLRLDVNYRTDYGTTFGFSSDLLTFGKTAGLTTVSGKIGDYLGLGLNSFYYTGNQNKFGLFGNISYNETPFNLYSDGVRQSRYNTKDLSLKVGLASLLRNDFLLAYGLNYSYADLNFLSGIKVPGVGYAKSNTNVYLRASLDTLDNQNFPTKGVKGEFSYDWGGIAEKKEVEYFGPTLIVDAYYPLSDRLVFGLGIAGGAVQGESIPLNQYLKLGGLANRYQYSELSFPGYNFQSKLAKEALIFNGLVRYEIYDNLHLGFKFSSGTFNEDTSTYFKSGKRRWGEYVTGGTLTLGYDSLIGPLNLGVSLNSDTKELITHINLGYFID